MKGSGKFLLPNLEYILKPNFTIDRPDLRRNWPYARNAKRGSPTTHNTYALRPPFPSPITTSLHRLDGAERGDGEGGGMKRGGRNSLCLRSGM